MGSFSLYPCQIRDSAPIEREGRRRGFWAMSRKPANCFNCIGGTGRRLYGHGKSQGNPSFPVQADMVLPFGAGLWPRSRN